MRIKDRRKSKKTFIRYAGKWILILSSITIIMNLYRMMTGNSDSGFAPIYTFLGVLAGLVFGTSRHSDYMKEKMQLSGSDIIEYGADDTVK